MEQTLSPRSLLARSAIPLVLIAALAGTPLWGGWVSLALVLGAWRGMGLRA